MLVVDRLAAGPGPAASPRRRGARRPTRPARCHSRAPTCPHSRRRPTRGRSALLAGAEGRTSCIPDPHPRQQRLGAAVATAGAVRRGRSAQARLAAALNYGIGSLARGARPRWPRRSGCRPAPRSSLARRTVDALVDPAPISGVVQPGRLRRRPRLSGGRRLAAQIVADQSVGPASCSAAACCPPSAPGAATEVHRPGAPRGRHTRADAAANCSRSPTCRRCLTDRRGRRDRRAAREARSPGRRRARRRPGRRYPRRCPPSTLTPTTSTRGGVTTSCGWRSAAAPPRTASAAPTPRPG